MGEVEEEEEEKDLQALCLAVFLVPATLLSSAVLGASWKAGS